MGGFHRAEDDQSDAHDEPDEEFFFPSSLRPTPPADPYSGFDPPVDQLPNVKRAMELAKIGEPGLAEELLRHQAKIGLPSEHHSLIQVAKKLDLPAAQLWLANNGQPGARSDAADRYPNPRWSPLNGWRVDPALAFGHIVQESAFRRTAVSGAGAVGLMQVLPVTAQMVSRNRGVPYSNAAMTDPKYNLEYGQSFIEMMRGSSATAGQLPRVIASYNAGPLPVARWAAINDKGDPLLWIESIPYWETRYYVPAVLRNMWVYQGLNDEGTPALKSMAEHRWPSFPDRHDAPQPLVDCSCYVLANCYTCGMPVEFEPRARSHPQCDADALQPQGAG